jgi:hypothetical protein
MYHVHLACVLEIDDILIQLIYCPTEDMTADILMTRRIFRIWVSVPLGPFVDT